jgi:hypothetical protein
MLVTAITAIIMYLQKWPKPVKIEVSITTFLWREIMGSDWPSGG